jgi:hypothetical protein
VTCLAEGAPVPTFTRHRGGKPLTIASNNVTLETCPNLDEQVPCNLPCCPVDCVVEPWGVWGDCKDGVKFRSRKVVTPEKCGGAACPVCYLEKDDCIDPNPNPNECDRGQACEDGVTLKGAAV